VAVEDEAAVAEYAALAAARAEAAAAARAALTQPAHVLPFLQPGRLVRVLAPAGADAPGGAAAGAPEAGPPADAAAARLASNGEAGTSGGTLPGLEDEGAWAAVVNFERVGSAKAAPGGGGGAAADGGGGGGGADGGGGEAGQYIVDVLVNCAPDLVPGRGPRRRARRGDGTLHAEPCCQCVRHACHDRVLPQVSKPRRGRGTRQSALYTYALLPRNAGQNTKALVSRRFLAPLRRATLARRRPRPVAPGAPGVPLVAPAPLGELAALSALRIHLPQDLRAPDARALAVKARAPARPDRAALRWRRGGRGEEGYLQLVVVGAQCYQKGHARPAAEDWWLKVKRAKGRRMWVLAIMPMHTFTGPDACEPRMAGPVEKPSAEGGSSCAWPGRGASGRWGARAPRRSPRCRSGTRAACRCWTPRRTCASTTPPFARRSGAPRPAPARSAPRAAPPPRH